MSLPRREVSHPYTPNNRTCVNLDLHTQLAFGLTELLNVEMCEHSSFNERIVRRVLLLNRVAATLPRSYSVACHHARKNLLRPDSDI